MVAVILGHYISQTRMSYYGAQYYRKYKFNLLNLNQPYSKSSHLSKEN